MPHSSCHPHPGPQPHPHRPAELSQQRDEAQQLLIPRVPEPPRHRDPVGSLGREGERWPWGNHRGHGASEPPDTRASGYLGGEALDGVVQGHRLGQVPAQQGQILPVAAAGAEAVPLGEAAPAGGRGTRGEQPPATGVPPQQGFCRDIT